MGARKDGGRVAPPPPGKSPNIFLHVRVFFSHGDFLTIWGPFSPYGGSFCGFPSPFQKFLQAPIVTTHNKNILSLYVCGLSLKRRGEGGELHISNFQPSECDIIYFLTKVEYHKYDSLHHQTLTDLLKCIAQNWHRIS